MQQKDERGPHSRDLLSGKDARPIGTGPNRKVKICGLSQNGREWVEFIYREFSSVDGLSIIFRAEAHYSPFTLAAVGKIPLSMVQVKLKPLYVVLCSQLR